MLIRKENFFNEVDIYHNLTQIILFPVSEEERGLETKVTFNNLSLKSPKSQNIFNGDLEISYIPDEYLIDFESLFNYLEQFQNQYIYYEKLITDVAEAIRRQAKPKTLQVTYRVFHKPNLKVEITKLQKSDLSACS